ncbi:MAG TPA: patatin-like phospholipase family protein, partial [Candidatus Krumholzibacteria bacterium]
GLLEEELMAGNALVLGGGGALGIAWEVGLLVGLLEEGIDVTGAQLIVATSAGSVVGTQIAVGETLEELLAEQVGPDDGALGRLIQIDLQGTQQIFMRWAGIQEVTTEVRREIGEMALGAKTVDEASWVEYFEEHIGDKTWPDRDLRVTAVDCESGDFQVLDRESGVSLARAVASSCAVPGLFPPVTINGRRYTDGGVRSGTSADLASGFDSVLIVAPIGARSDGIDPLLGRQARQEAEALRAAGSRVEQVFPDAGSLEAIGFNRMDGSRRGVSAEAGMAQGRALAGRLAEGWAKAAAA